MLTAAMTQTEELTDLHLALILGGQLLGALLHLLPQLSHLLGLLQLD